MQGMNRTQTNAEIRIGPQAEAHKHPPIHDKLEEPHSITITSSGILHQQASQLGKSGLRRVLTYGTFDLLHYGHIRLLKQAAALGDYLVVALSTDEFNAQKGKKSFYSYSVRKEMLEAIRYVDLVIPENSWEQKATDVETFQIDTVCMGSDWENDPRFEALRDICQVQYLNRTPGISTSDIKTSLKG